MIYTLNKRNFTLNYTVDRYTDTSLAHNSKFVDNLSIREKNTMKHKRCKTLFAFKWLTIETQVHNEKKWYTYNIFYLKC